MGKEYYEGSGFEPETVIEMLVTFLLQKKVPRQTEGEAPSLLGRRALPAGRVCRVFGWLMYPVPCACRIVAALGS